MTPFAAIMKSSMSALARFFSSGRSAVSTPSSNTGRASTVSRSSAPCRARRRFIRRATSSWMRSCSASPGTAETLSGAAAAPSSQAATARYASFAWFTTTAR